MHTNENKVATLVTGGGKTYEVALPQLCEFLENCNNKLQLSGRDDLDFELQEIIDAVIDGAANDGHAGALKRHLVFLREIDLLFKGMLYQRQES